MSKRAGDYDEHPVAREIDNFLRPIVDAAMAKVPQVERDVVDALSKMEIASAVWGEGAVRRALAKYGASWPELPESAKEMIRRINRGLGDENRNASQAGPSASASPVAHKHVRGIGVGMQAQDEDGDGL